MEIDLNCAQCSQDYKDENPPRLLGCGHTFCHSCLQTLLSQKEETTFVVCPEDQQETQIHSSLEQLPKNIALMKLIEGRKKNNSNNSSSSIRDASFDVSKINKEEQCQEDQVAQQLISCINRAGQQKEDQLLQPQTKPDSLTVDTNQQNKEVVNRSPEKEEVEMCLLHQKPIQVVCMNDYERLCSKCALFGVHKTHDFKGIQEIERENKKYYQFIINVFDDKATFMDKVSKKTVENDLLELLSVKTTKMRRQITDKFKVLMDELVKAEKYALNRLDELNTIIEKNLISSLKLDTRLSQSYDQWQENTLEVIRQSQQPSSDGHLAFYLRRSQIMHQGEDLLTKLKNMQDKAYDHSVQFIEDFNISFHDSTFHHAVHSVVEILDRPKEEEKTKPQKLKENSATLANCGFQEIKRSPPQLHRHQSQQSLLEACDFETQSFAGDLVGSRVLDQSFVSVREDHISHQRQHKQQHTTRPLIKRKVPIVKEKEKCLIKEAPSSVLHHPSGTNVHNSAKRKMKALKVPQKYEKVVEGIMNDSLEVVDLTNAQLGDSSIVHLMQMMKDNVRVKTVKLIRNKLTDDSILKMLPYLTNVMSLNLSQNQLTDHVLNLFIDNRHSLPMLKSLVLSQTKIVERKSKTLVERLRKMEVAVSV